MSVKTSTTITFESFGLTDTFYFKDASLNIIKPCNVIVGVTYSVWSVYGTIQEYWNRSGKSFVTADYSYSDSMGIFTPFMPPYDISQVAGEYMILPTLTIELGTVKFAFYFSNVPFGLSVNAQSEFNARITFTTTAIDNAKLTTELNLKAIGYSDVYFLKDPSNNVVQVKDAELGVTYSMWSLFGNIFEYYTYNYNTHPTSFNQYQPLFYRGTNSDPLIGKLTAYEILPVYPLLFQNDPAVYEFGDFTIRPGHIQNIALYANSGPDVTSNPEAQYYWALNIETTVGQEAIVVQNTTNSISPSTGSMVVEGGIGVQLDFNIGGNLIASKKRMICSKYFSSQKLTFDMALGMNIHMSLDIGQFQSITFVNIPSEPLSCYTFNFFIQQPTTTVSYYLRPPNNIFKIICKDIKRYNAICYGESNNNFPTTTNIIVQQITIMNEGTSQFPKFVALSSATAYS